MAFVVNKVEERDDIGSLRRGFDAMDFRSRDFLDLKEIKTAAKLLGEKLDREVGQVRLYIEI